MEGGGRSIHGEGSASCLGLRAEARVRLYEAVLLTCYLWLLSTSTPEKIIAGALLCPHSWEKPLQVLR